MDVRMDPLGQEYVRIPCGTYRVGNDSPAAHPNESPSRIVQISEELWISQRPVLQSIWSAVMESNPSRFSEGFEAGLRPVERIDWMEANDFGDKLSRHLNDLEGWHIEGEFRLPSEAEWEIAARAGTVEEWYCGNQDREIHQYVWNAGNSGGTSQAVGQKPANPWGLHDICGNVAEWCLDSWHENMQGAPIDASPWLSGGDSGRRVHRGGSWFTESEATRCSSRSSAPVDRKSDGIGMRLLWQAL